VQARVQLDQRLRVVHEPRLDQLEYVVNLHLVHQALPTFTNECHQKRDQKLFLRRRKEERVKRKTNRQLPGPRPESSLTVDARGTPGRRPSKLTTLRIRSPL
jgi:hypothetical protein